MARARNAGTAKKKATGRENEGKTNNKNEKEFHVC